MFIVKIHYAGSQHPSVHRIQLFRPGISLFYRQSGVAVEESMHADKEGAALKKSCCFAQRTFYTFSHTSKLVLLYPDTYPDS